MQKYTWFYTLSQRLEPEAQKKLSHDFDAFLQQWKSHGTPVSGLIQIQYGKFVIIQSDPKEDRPSGCSIDSLKRNVEAILQQNGLKCLDAAHVCFRNSAEEIQHVHFSEIPTLVEEGTLTAKTPVFDNSLGQSDDLGKWELPMEATWLKRYLGVKA